MTVDNGQVQINETQNLARFFTENRAISWVLLITVFCWGYFGYQTMPKRKDPNIPLNIASVVTPWPGKSAQEVEQLITYPIEQSISENTKIRPLSNREWGLKSTSLPGISIIQVRLSAKVGNDDTLQEFNQINLLLKNLSTSLPPGAGPITLNTGYSDTAAIMLEVASPMENEVALSLRARDIRQAIEKVRAAQPHAGLQHMSIVFSFPRAVNPVAGERLLRLFSEQIAKLQPQWSFDTFAGSAFVGLDLALPKAVDKDRVHQFTEQFLLKHFGLQQFHPDLWPPVVIVDPDQTLQAVTESAGAKYSYRQLDDFTDLMTRNLGLVPEVSKVTRAGVLPEQIYLAYSQQQMAENGIQPTQIKNAISARNSVYPGGAMQLDGISVNIEPGGVIDNTAQLADVVIDKDSNGTPVYLRSVAEIHRGYQYPPRFLNYFNWLDSESGLWTRSPAISVAAFMRDGEQLGAFAKGVEQTLSLLKSQLPDDLVIDSVSNQAQQAEESTELFTTALIEAIVMVVLVAFIGFREWRSAVVMLIAMPITISMTFGMIAALGVDVQQVSIVALIIALGLLVDDPVVASDAIKRDLNQGHRPIIAAWLGPTKLASAILYATITNVAAYLPLLLLTGDIGHFLYSLPVVMTCSLIASRIVSMTFIPCLGYYLIRANTRAEPSLEQRRSEGFSGFYYRLGCQAIKHRKKVLLASLLILLTGGVLKTRLVDSFFPYDVQYLSYVDIWLRNNANLDDTARAAQSAVSVIEQVTEQYGREHPDENGKPVHYLESVTTNLGGSGPKFWFSVISQIKQKNYAQLVIRVTDKEVTPTLIDRWQAALSAQVPGAMINVNQLQTQPVDYPVAIRISSQAALDGPAGSNDIGTLEDLAEQIKVMIREVSIAERVNDNWGNPDFTVELDVNDDQVKLSGVTDADISFSTELAINGNKMTEIREGDKQIPVVALLPLSERAQLSDINNFYVYSRTKNVKVPLGEVASLAYTLQTSKIVRMGQFRAITVYAYPKPGYFPSQVMKALSKRLDAFEASLPAGYQLEISGVAASSSNGTSQLVRVLVICIGLIYVALVIQFRSSVKPLLVFAAVPYGVCGALAGLYIMHSTFGFMAFLGIVALVGVIVSHIIVLFDFVEEAHARGEPLQEALLDAGIFRLRPVLITVAATIMALLPLSFHGGPLWQPLCFAQIGGLAFATVVTLLLVPVMYSVFVLDLKIVKWSGATVS